VKEEFTTLIALSAFADQVKGKLEFQSLRRRIKAIDIRWHSETETRQILGQIASTPYRASPDALLFVN